MSDAPQVIVFDVNETLSDLGPLSRRFADLGVPGHLAPLWFASLLRDGFALTAAGQSRPFAEIGAGVLHRLLAGHELAGAFQGDRDAAVAHVLEGFAALGVHPDVPEGVQALHRAGFRLATLSNGAAEVGDRLLTAAALRDRFERLLSVQDAGAWKPVRAAYEYAARELGVAPAAMMLVAVHPWDIDGAARAGLRTAWIDRERGEYPAHFTPPTVTVSALGDLAAVLAPAPD